MNNNTDISIIIPTLNEEKNIVILVKRLVHTLRDTSLNGEIIFIDDHSTDTTCRVIKQMREKYKEECVISVFTKIGKLGKAQSLLEGFAHAKYDIIAMIDADLQYPPEAIPAMVQKLIHGVDIVVADRHHEKTTFVRKMLSRSFNRVFSQYLHDLSCDVQSGLKVFRKSILDDVTLDPSPWTFDMEFLLSARNYGYTIDTVNIDFRERVAGTSKIHVLQAAWEIGWRAIMLKLRGCKPRHIAGNSDMRGAGVKHNQQHFITHTTLHHSQSAIETFHLWQKIFLWACVLFLVVVFMINPLHAGIVCTGVMSFIYFADTVFGLFLVSRSFTHNVEIKSTEDEIRALDDTQLPIYTIFCPLYREAIVLPHFLRSVAKIDWPKDKLEVLLLLEEDDVETITVAREMRLPEYVHVVVVPHSMPKTKPKACNYGLSHATGEHIVIYDAEDKPDPQQLKKAYLGFRKAGRDVRCLQAKLNYYNAHQNLLTKLFTAEYSLWFDVNLPGLQSIGTIIPLGGTSNHFYTQDLKDFQGWDPFNVTEDCDLGARIFSRGCKTAVIDSVTLEEANSNFKNWLRQRSRWIKGYMQTYLVHMRDPRQFFGDNKWHALVFQLVVGGKISFMLINPLLWLMTIAYFALNTLVGPAIEALYPPVIFYMAGISLVLGNFLYVYYYMIGCAKREHWSLIKYVFFVPLYWIAVSVAASIAIYQLFVKPHYWEKTKHGLHLIKRERWDVLGYVNRVHDMITAHYSACKSIVHKRMISMQKKRVIGMLFSREGVYFQLILWANFLNFAFNAYLGRALAFEDLALVTTVSTLWYLASIFIFPFATTINHRASILTTSEGQEASLDFLYAILRKSIILVVGVLAFWIVSVPLISQYLNIEHVSVLYIFTFAIFFGVVAAAYRGFLQANLFLFSVGIIAFGEPFSKFLFAVFFVQRDMSSLVYLSVPLSITVVAIISVLFLMGKKITSKTKRDFAFPTRFFFASFMTNISFAMFLSLDIVLTKHYFSSDVAGQYALLSLVGKMIFYLGALPSMLMVTHVGRAIGLGKNAHHIFRLVYFISALVVMVSFVTFGVGGAFFAPLLFGAKATNIVVYLPMYAFSMALFTLTSVTITYHLSKRNYFFNIVSFVFALCMIGGIMIYHRSIWDIVLVMFYTSITSWTIIGAMHYFEKHLPFLARGVRDLVDVFFGDLPHVGAQAKNGKNILIFNWRDNKHKFAGGAEVYIHEMSKLWVKQGNHVTIFCGNDGHAPRSEVIDGVEIVRRGGFYFVYVWAFVYYMVRFRGKYDVIIDCQNGVPFFTPIYAKEPIFCLMHHVHQDVFFNYLVKPLALFACWLEKDLMPIVYKNKVFITVSESSYRGIESLGLGKKGVHVVNPGIYLDEYIEGEKSERPMILFLGRLKAYKSVDILIRAFKKVLHDVPDAHLVIAGEGDAERYLKDLASGLGLTDDQIIFKGRVSEKEKIALLQSAWVMVNPSLMEGWGIVNIEANACGTPVIASDVPGLRDSVRDNHSGCLVPYGDINAFAQQITQIVADAKEMEKMKETSRLWAENFAWEKSSDMFYSVIAEK